MTAKMEKYPTLTNTFGFCLVHDPTFPELGQVTQNSCTRKALGTVRAGQFTGHVLQLLHSKQCPSTKTLHITVCVTFSPKIHNSMLVGASKQHNNNHMRRKISLSGTHSSFT